MSVAYKQDLKAMFVAYISLTAVFALTFPEEAVSKAYPVEYFVGEKISVSCEKNTCFVGQDILKTNDLNVITAIYKNKHYDTSEECSEVLSLYKSKILDSGFFPLSSSKTDFGGVFTVDKNSYHAKMKCDYNFMIAKITTI